MMKKENLLKTFRRYSSQSDERLLPLINEYISTGRRRNVLQKSLISMVIPSIVIGALTGILKRFLNMENSFLLSDIAASIISVLLIMIVSICFRRDIKDYLMSKNGICFNRTKAFNPTHFTRG